MRRVTVVARYLVPGDILVPTGRTVERVIPDGVFKRTPGDIPTRTRFPAGEVEVKVDGVVRYWNKRTHVTVDRP